MKIAGDGSFKIRMFDRTIRTLKYLMYALELKLNLIFFSILDSKGYRYIGEAGTLNMSQGALVVLNGHESSIQLYIFQGSTIIRDAAVTNSSLADEKVTKLGHMRENDMV